MSQSDRAQVLKDLFDAFSATEKPAPLATYKGSYCDEEVDVFNQIDWQTATYSEFLDGQEGAIICPARTKLYLLPYLFQMVLLRRHGSTDGAVDNIATYLETWPVEADVERLLSDGQKAAIVKAWQYLDATIYSASGSHIGHVLETRWNVERRS